ncbi:MAG: UDP-N-acetylmuramate--L-alanine ligase, partial [Clostridia bacterium]|nr:UDP-N-acetylmuramate--L-alanine ligase [Clostridia bacterium]
STTQKHSIERAQFLGLLCQEFSNTIAISGTHGKTTTTAMLAFALQSISPTVHLGGMINNYGNLILGKHSFFITEACEFNKSFLHIKPNVCIITNTEKEHMDCYKNEQDLLNSFYQFAHQTKDLIVIQNNNPILHNLRKSNANITTFGLDNKADIYATNITQNNAKFSFDCIYNKTKLGTINLNILGKHNILNALACIAVSLHYGVEFEKIKQGLESFTGVERRFEFLKHSPCTLIHDYAHHPTEIKASLATAKLVKKNRILCVFEPHTYSRTKSLMPEFLKCFNDADEVLLLPTYSAREKPIKGGSSFDIFLNLPDEINCQYFINQIKLFNYLKQEVQPNDLVIFLGAGTIGDFAKKFLEY